MRSLFWIPVTLLLAFSCREQRVQYPKLDELDSYIAARPVYETRKKDQLEGIWKLAAGTQSARRLCDYSMYAAEEFFSYNFDSTQVCLKKSLELAEQIRDTDRYNRAAIMLGHLYAKAGHYMEAYNRLMGQIDTSTLSEALKVDYLLALYDFSRDLAGNSGMVERPPLAEQEVYRTRLYALLPKDSERWRQLKMDELASAGRLAEADSVGHLLIAGTQPQEHQYAIYAYELSEIAERMLMLPAEVTGSVEADQAVEQNVSMRLERMKADILSESANRNQTFFEDEMDKLDTWASDMKVSLEREITDLDAEIKLRKAEAKKMLQLKDKVAAQRNIKELEKKRADKRQNLYEAQDEVDARKEELLTKVEKMLEQKVEEMELFTLRWRLV